jgi:hypothetical protein
LNAPTGALTSLHADVRAGQSARKPSVAARLSARLPRRRHRLPPGPESAELPQRGQGDEFVHDGSVLLPTLGDEIAPDSRRALLTDLYTEVCASWRMLVDVRFKLLGLVPAVSALALIQLFEKSDGAEKVGDAVQLVVCMLAFAVTVGLFVYDRRNSGLHDDLISRGRRIERELGMENASSSAAVEHVMRCSPTTPR